MHARHNNQAITGIAVWLIVMLAFATLLVLLKFQHEWIVNIISRKTLIAFVIVGFFLQYFFFWGGSHLAKAKGCSNGMLFVGIFYPAQLIIFAILLFAMPDNYSSRTRKHKSSHDESPIARIVRYRRNAF